VNCSPGWDIGSLASRARIGEWESEFSPPCEGQHGLDISSNLREKFHISQIMENVNIRMMELFVLIDFK
jgi:hypothetical protein